MLGLLLDDARVQGMGRVLAVCDENNIASHRTILACGGAYEDTRLDPEEHTAVKRFWITTG